MAHGVAETCFQVLSAIQLRNADSLAVGGVRRRYRIVRLRPLGGKGSRPRTNLRMPSKPLGANLPAGQFPRRRQEYDIPIDTDRDEQA